MVGASSLGDAINASPSCSCSRFVPGAHERAERRPRKYAARKGISGAGCTIYHSRPDPPQNALQAAISYRSGWHCGHRNTFVHPKPKPKPRSEFTTSHSTVAREATLTGRPPSTSQSRPSSGIVCGTCQCASRCGYPCARARSRSRPGRGGAGRAAAGPARMRTRARRRR